MSCQKAGIPESGGSESHGLCAADDLTCEMAVECVYRATGQGVVGQEQPAKDFDVGVAAVVQHRQETGQPLDDLAVLTEEHFGNAENTVTLDCDDLVIAK